MVSQSGFNQRSRSLRGVCVCVCTCMHDMHFVCTYVHTYPCIYTHIHTHICIYIYTSLYLSIYLSIYLPTWVICYRSWTLHNCGNCFVFVKLLLSDAGASHPQEGSCEGKKDVIWGEKGKLNLQEKLEPTRMDWLESVPVLPTSNRDEIGNTQRRWLLSPWGKGSPGPEPAGAQHLREVRAGKRVSPNSFHRKLLNVKTTMAVASRPPSNACRKISLVAHSNQKHTRKEVWEMGFIWSSWSDMCRVTMAEGKGNGREEEEVGEKDARWVD